MARPDLVVDDAETSLASETGTRRSPSTADKACAGLAKLPKQPTGTGDNKHCLHSFDRSGWSLIPGHVIILGSSRTTGQCKAGHSLHTQYD
jgi:hypothetical protein